MFWDNSAVFDSSVAPTSVLSLVALVWIASIEAEAGKHGHWGWATSTSRSQSPGHDKRWAMPIGKASGGDPAIP